MVCVGKVLGRDKLISYQPVVNLSHHHTGLKQGVESQEVLITNTKSTGEGVHQAGS